MEQTTRILVVGGGGIGGVIASTLLEAGHGLALVARPSIAEALSLRGFDLSDERGRRTIRGAAELLEELPSTGAFDFVLLAVPPDALVETARRAAPLLTGTGCLVCFQNGLAEERLAGLVGPERVIGAVVAWGASSPAPGVYEKTSAGGFTLGRLDGVVDDGRLVLLSEILSTVGPARITGNLAGARWSKLAINCAVSSLGTIGGARVGELMRHRFVRRLALEVMTEVVQVALAEGIRLERIAGLDLRWVALRRGEASPTLLAKHGILLAVGARYRRLRSSMLAAIERGRIPPVDFLNGEVVERARRHGIEATVNERIVELVHAIGRREARSGLLTLQRLHEETRQRRAVA